MQNRCLLLKYPANQNKPRTANHQLLLLWAVSLLFFGLFNTWMVKADEPQDGSILELTLEKAIQLAQENNPDYHSALTAGEVARYNVEAAKRQHYPRIDLFASYLYSPIQQKRVIQRAKLEDLPKFGDKFDSQVATLGIRARLPIYTGGKITAQAEEAALDQQGTEALARRTLDNLVLAVTDRFYRVLLLEQVQKAEKASLRNILESKRVVQQLLKVGRAPRLDFLRVETRLSEIRQSLIRTDRSIEVTRAELQRLLGMSETELRILRLRGEFNYRPHLQVDFEQYLERALIERPDYQALVAELNAQAQRVRVEDSNNLPQIYLEATYFGAGGIDGNTKVQDDAVLSLTLSQKLFDGGVVNSRRDRENARYQQLQEQLSDLRLKIGFEIKTALEDIHEAGKRMQNTKAVLALADEALRIEQVRLKTGKGVINDVLLAQADQLISEVEHVTALVNHRVAMAYLVRATGQSVNTRY